LARKEAAVATKLKPIATQAHAEPSPARFVDKKTVGGQICWHCLIDLST
jgi:hypothetical protein